MELDFDTKIVLTTPLRIASKELYFSENVDTEGLGSSIGRAARFLVKAPDTILIVPDIGNWMEVTIDKVMTEEVWVQIMDGTDHPDILAFPWDAVRLPWRHYDNHIRFDKPHRAKRQL